MQRISGTIITLNEEDRIAEAIASLACCDEVIVVDSGSTDRTCDIARQHGARVLTREWDSYSKQKNFAASQAAHDWILSLDADERISAELAAEICRWQQHSATFSAARMPRRAFYLGGWIKHSGWYPDLKTRLYDRRHAGWQGDFVHESLSVDGPVGRFAGDILHYPYRSRSDHLRRIDRYTRLAAEAARTSGRRANPLKLLLGPPAAFFKTLFLQAGILDGWRGFAIAWMGARYVLLREYRLWR
jgi:glycosyltransferase involved in cell wall biosynthesis